MVVGHRLRRRKFVQYPTGMSPLLPLKMCLGILLFYSPLCVAHVCHWMWGKCILNAGVDLGPTRSSADFECYHLSRIDLLAVLVCIGRVCRVPSGVQVLDLLGYHTPPNLYLYRQGRDRGILEERISTRTGSVHIPEAYNVDFLHAQSRQPLLRQNLLYVQFELRCPPR